MTSFAAAGAGVKPCTFLLPGRRGYLDSYGVDDSNRSNALFYAYTKSAAADALSVTGAGYWTFGYFQGQGESSTTGTVVVTIDGVTVLDDTVSADIQYTGMCQVGSIFYAGSVGPGITRVRVPFNKSLLVNVQSDGDARYYYDYYLT
tara:strand:- start:1837 stop:2277 length:441 start_codon:yes stop_codon:yes gene_type:complete